MIMHDVNDVNDIDVNDNDVNDDVNGDMNDNA